MTWEELWYDPSPAHRIMAAALAPASAMYGIGIRVARWFSAPPQAVPGLRVISVGNLVAGGAGKTPAVIFLAGCAHRGGERVAVLSRGYGRKSREVVRFESGSLPPVEAVGDEPRLIARRCPGVTVWVGSDRLALARAAQAQGATLAILDDGFQHRRLSRDIDILVRSGEGTGHLLPWGPLREPVSAAVRADVVWLRDDAEAAGSCLVRARYFVSGVETPAGELRPPEVLRGTRVAVLAGVARPRRLLDTVRGLGAHLGAAHLYRDHHHFSAAELERARADGTLLTTEKDRERLPEGHRAHVLRMDVQLTSGLEALTKLLGFPLR